MANTKKNGVSVGVAGAALAATAAAAAAGYYFYASTDAKKHRKIAAKWATDMKKDVVKRAKQVQKLDAKAMSKIVDEATKVYEKARSIKKEDLVSAGRELKKNWTLIAKELKGGATHSVKRASVVAKKSVKKAVRKAKKAVK